MTKIWEIKMRVIATQQVCSCIIGHGSLFCCVKSS
uniref:Uncharacterized protein n=1 Tax=Rhizophora mucronata TaxID=61149 RepID=A0A2P2PXR9_RHIMU